MSALSPPSVINFSVYFYIFISTTIHDYSRYSEIVPEDWSTLQSFSRVSLPKDYSRLPTRSATRPFPSLYRVAKDLYIVFRVSSVPFVRIFQPPLG